MDERLQLKDLKLKDCINGLTHEGMAACELMKMNECRESEVVGSQ
jgi:hypothetical protein